MILEQRVVHLPEFVLHRGGFGQLRCRLGVNVDVNEGQVTKNESNVFAKCAKEFFHDGVRLATIWTLVVAILHQSDRRIVGTSRVIIRSHGNGELCAAHDSASTARSAPSAPGFSPRGEISFQETCLVRSRTKRARSEMPSSFRYTP